MSHIAVATIDLIVAALAGVTIFLLLDIASLVGPAHLRLAWRTLGAMSACCIVLLFVHAAFSLGRPATAQDLVGGAIFLIGVSFILSIACLSRSTVHDMLRVERVAHLDALTCVGNRRYFDDSLAAAVREAMRRRLPLSVIVFDIDHFKAVNDAHGHGVGDEVLRRVARLSADLMSSVGTVCRVGGEEFAVIVPRTEAVFVPPLAEKLRSSIASLRIEVNERPALSVTVSLGLATLARGETGASLLRRADQALYAAKRGGRDRLRIAS